MIPPRSRQLLLSLLLAVAVLGLILPAVRADTDVSHPDQRGGEAARALLPYVKPQEMIMRSPLIIEGSILDISTSRWNTDHTLLYTDYTLSVRRSLKGQIGSTVVVRNPGGLDPASGEYLTYGDAADFSSGGDYVLLLTTENLQLLDMTDGNQYYVAFWAGGTYHVRDSWLENQLHDDFSEPLPHFERRVVALNGGQPDPYPLTGRPLYDTRDNS